MTEYCDNTDCTGDYTQDDLYLVEMREEFEGGNVIWCRNCMNTDEAFIEKVVCKVTDLDFDFHMKKIEEDEI